MTNMKWKVFGFLLENLWQSLEIFSSLRESVSAKMRKIKLLHVIEPKTVECYRGTYIRPSRQCEYNILTHL